MGREPLYRGKRIDNGEWVYGYFAKYVNIKAQVYSAILIFDEETGDVYSDGITPIEEDSRCEFTGLFDKNGNKIFEGDIVRYKIGYYYSSGLAFPPETEEDYANLHNKHIRTEQVIYDNGQYTPRPDIVEVGSDEAAVCYDFEAVLP